MYYLKVPPTWDEFRAGLSRNIKESLRKCYNSLKRDGHEFTFRAIARPEEAGASIARFLELHTARAAADVSVSHNNVFATPQSRAFLADYTLAMAERGQLRVFQIEIAGVVVATRIGFTFGRTLYLYYSGYDPDWGRYSIMTTVVAEAIKWAIANGYTIVNLSPGTDVSKTRWGPEERQFHGAVMQSPRRRSRIAHRIYDDFVRYTRSNTPLSNLLSTLQRGA
jgi:CelD/BcsL family acetyltransferase involved in cellulose biosynthesis